MRRDHAVFWDNLAGLSTPSIGVAIPGEFQGNSDLLPDYAVHPGLFADRKVVLLVLDRWYSGTDLFELSVPSPPDSQTK